MEHIPHVQEENRFIHIHADTEGEASLFQKAGELSLASIITK